MSALTNQSNDLNISWHTLNQIWIAVQTVWNDQVRWQFQREHWEPLQQSVDATARQTSHLSQIIAQARQNVR